MVKSKSRNRLVNVRLEIMNFFCPNLSDSLPLIGPAIRNAISKRISLTPA